MVIKFSKPYLEELYYTAKCSDKKIRLQPQVIKNYIRRVINLAEAPNVEALYQVHSLNYEVLVGSKKGISSVRIDKQYRLEFTVTTSDETPPVTTICDLIEITNHYK